MFSFDEDLGLDGYGEEGPQRYIANFNVDGDTPYPFINGSAKNSREDTGTEGGGWARVWLFSPFFVIPAVKKVYATKDDFEEKKLHYENLRNDAANAKSYADLLVNINGGFQLESWLFSVEYSRAVNDQFS